MVENLSLYPGKLTSPGITTKNNRYYKVLVTLDCNPSYLGGRDQEDWNSKPVWTNSRIHQSPGAFWYPPNTLPIRY
jgi:hypothetical protein